MNGQTTYLRTKGAEARASAGFALPAAIFALVVVAFLVTGGIHLATQESRIGLATDRGTQAFYVAESGLHSAMAQWIPMTSGLTEWSAPATLTGTTPAGDWTVNITRVHEQLFFARSTGAVEAGGGAQATRTVGQFGRVFILRFDPTGAVVLPTGVHANGNPLKVDGDDNSDPAWLSHWAAMCPATGPSLPGVVTADESAVTCTGAGTGGSCSQFEGDPSVLEDPDLIEQQWNDIEAQWDQFVEYATHLVPPGDHVPQVATYTDSDGNVHCDTSVLMNWGAPHDPSGPCGDHFPLIYVNGNLQLSGDARGQGILLVEGDFRIVGNARFDGVILVNGEFSTGSGTPQINGSLLARQGGTLDGNGRVQYSSCAITQAINMNNTARLRPLAERSWVDLTGASF